MSTTWCKGTAVSTPAFVVDRSLLGTEKHLKWDDGKLSWVPERKPVDYLLSGRVKLLDDRCLDALLRLNGQAIDLTPPKPYVRASSLLVSGSGYSGPVPWQSFMPEEAHRTLSKRIVSQALEALAHVDRRYYEETWGHGNAILRRLTRAKVDPARLKELEAAQDTNVFIAQTFRPEPDSFAQPATYDRFGTLTGRCTVSSGPNVLVLKKQSRDVLVSRFKGGSVMSLDFASLEPRVLFYEAGRSCVQQDLYGYVAGDLGYDRDAVKASVISTMYGRNRHVLKRALEKIRQGMDASRKMMAAANTDELIDRVNTAFDVQGLLSRVKGGYLNDGFILNKYGRRVQVDEPLDHVMVNYYCQSTGADVALVGFENVMQRLETEAPRTVALFVLYDALVLDVPPEELDAVKGVKTVAVEGYDRPFWLKATKFG